MTERLRRLAEAPVLVPALTTVGAVLAARTSFPGRSCRHVVTRAQTHTCVTKRRFCVLRSNRCDSCETTFHFLLRRVASTFSPYGILHTCPEMAQAWLFGCFVSIFIYARRNRKEQHSLLFAPASLWLFTDEQSSTCVFTLTESQFVARAGACAALAM